MGAGSAMEDHLGLVILPLFAAEVLADTSAGGARGGRAGDTRRTDGVVPELTHGVPTAVAVDIPFYHRLFREAGVAQETAAMVDGSGRRPVVGEPHGIRCGQCSTPCQLDR